MYLAAFPPRGDFIAGDTGPDPDDCRARGGVPAFTILHGGYNAPFPYGTQYRAWTCQLPAAPAGGGTNVNVSVPTRVDTQVSPQISPVMVQQEHPTNSPVNATPSQVAPGNTQTEVTHAPPIQNQPSIDYAKIIDEQRKADAEAAARDQAMIDKLLNFFAPSAPAQPSAPSGGSVYVPPPPVTYDAGMPAPSPAPIPAGGGAPVEAGMSKLGMAALALAALGLLVSRSKSSGVHRRGKRR